jgi:hypothetical protein
MEKHKFKTLELIGKYDHNHQPYSKVCPGCEKVADNVALAKLAYTFDACTCRDKGIDYDHIVEQLWHKACLVAYMLKHEYELLDYRYMNSEHTIKEV